MSGFGQKLREVECRVQPVHYHVQVREENQMAHEVDKKSEQIQRGLEENILRRRAQKAIEQNTR